MWRANPRPPNYTPFPQNAFSVGGGGGGGGGRGREEEWRSERTEQETKRHRGGFCEKEKREEKCGRGSEGGLVMRGEERKKERKSIYLQLPCEMLMGSLSSGKPAPAICSSVK